MSLRCTCYKDKDRFRQKREEWKTGYRKRTGAFLYPARDYSIYEDMAILEHSIPDRELSKKIERSVNAIQKRRWFLKKNETD